MSWVYLLGIPLGWQVYLLHRITCSFAVCYPRDIHVPKRYGPPKMQSKTYTQEVYPRHIYLLGDRYTSWVTGYTSWVTRVKWMLSKTYRQEPKTHTCYPRGIPQQVYPRHIPVKNPRHVCVTQDVYPTGIPKTYTGQDTSWVTGYTSWVTRVKWMLSKTYRQEPKTYTCYPRGIPNRYIQDIYRSRTQDIYVLPNRYTQQVYPRHIQVRIPLGWRVYLLGNTC